MQPGPLPFKRSGERVWTLLASLFIGLVMLLVLLAVGLLGFMCRYQSSLAPVVIAVG